MTHATPGAQIHQTLDVHGHFTTQIAFDDPLCNLRAQRRDFGVGQVLHPGGRIDACQLAAVFRTRAADAVDVGKPHPYVLVHRDVDAGNTCHGLTLPLLVARLGTDHVDDALAAHDLAVLADLLY